MACGQELCPSWSGDGRACPCALLDLPDWPGVALDDAQEEADEMIAQGATTDVEY